MTDAFLVQIADTLHQLLHNVDDCILFDPSLADELRLDPVSKGSLRSILHHDVNSLLWFDGLEDARNLRMVDLLECRKLILLQSPENLVSFLEFVKPDALYANLCFCLLVFSKIDRWMIVCWLLDCLLNLIQIVAWLAEYLFLSHSLSLFFDGSSHSLKSLILLGGILPLTAVIWSLIRVARLMSCILWSWLLNAIGFVVAFWC